MFEDVIKFIRNDFEIPDKQIQLHAPIFVGNEKKYVLEAIDSTFVSSVGKFVDKFENDIRDYTGAKHAIAAVNGTAALHVALQLAGVGAGDLVITQPLTFIATCNAIKYTQASPVFIDIDKDTLGLSPNSLEKFLKNEADIKNGKLIHKATGKKIAACVPMHTFGHPVHLDELLNVCKQYNLPIVEDSAESLGSFYKGQHTGTMGLLGAFSFNGNKTITCGGGGVVVTNDSELARLTKHLTTQAKKPHPWNFDHDHIGYNYRMPNINAALGCAQLEMLDTYLESKRQLAGRYKSFFEKQGITFVGEPENCRSNFWLNAILLKDQKERDAFLVETNQQKIMTRPAWTLMNKLDMFSQDIAGDLTNAIFIEERLVNIPSSPRVLIR